MKWNNKIVLAGIVAVMMIGGLAEAAESFTVATFADPSANSSNPLFSVVWPNGSAGTVNGGWADGKDGLTLEIPFAGTSFNNAWFQMDELTITGTATVFGQKFGQTDAGQIRFYEQGSSVNPLLVLAFDSALISQVAMGSNDFFANVTITGSVIPGTLSDEVFSFGFANISPLNDNANTKGFTATSAFTSSAVPEPATIMLFGFGGLGLLRKRK